MIVDEASRSSELINLVASILPANPFYARKFAHLRPDAIDPHSIPFTTKAELLADQEEHPPYGTNLTFPLEKYSRLHQTSGTTTGKPLRWLDTPQSWEKMLGAWRLIFEKIGLNRGDRFFFPFSFGPFLGFWTAFEAASRLGYFCLPGGGMSSSARLKFMLDHQSTVVFCTPTYALHLAEVAAEEKVNLAGSTVRAVVVAGEPGGSIPSIRQRIETAWGARVFDHYGMTEVGPVSVESIAAPREQIILESHYIAEIVSPYSDQPTPIGEVGELVLTNLTRVGSPLIRYRTGDLVCRSESLARLPEGILGRTDEMIHLRGNNVYPGALEAILRRFPEVAEYRVTIDESGAMAEVRIEIEPIPEAGEGITEQIGKAIRDELLFRVEVKIVSNLPRFEMKAKRMIRKKKINSEM